MMYVFIQHNHLLVLLKCSHFCRWLHAILFSVSETREGCGEGEAETGRDSQLRGQGKTSSPLYTGGINHFFKIEILLAAEINGMTVWYINVLLKLLLLVCQRCGSIHSRTNSQMDLHKRSIERDMEKTYPRIPFYQHWPSLPVNMPPSVLQGPGHSGGPGGFGGVEWLW